MYLNNKRIFRLEGEFSILSLIDKSLKSLLREGHFSQSRESKSQKFSWRVGPNHGGPSYDTEVWPLHF